MIEHIPDKVRYDSRLVETVRDVVVALILSVDVSTKRRQLEMIRESAGDIDEANVLVTREILDTQSSGLRLPLLDLAFPVLRRLTYQQQLEFFQLIERLIPLDGKVSSFEYLLSRLLQQMLLENRRPADTRGKKLLKLGALQEQCCVVFSVVAVFGHESMETARRAYNAGMQRLYGSERWPEFSPPVGWDTQFDAALADIDRARPLIKGEVISSLQLMIAFDDHFSIEEYEMLRVISALLHCPLPLLEGNSHWHVE